MTTGSGLDIAIVLAAGEGTRMKSATSKVLHSIAGRTIVGHVLAALAPLAPKDLRVVVGSSRESVEPHIKEIAPNATTVFQAERNGTGHAVQLALAGIKAEGSVLVLAGDTPLLTTFTLKEFLDVHHYELAFQERENIHSKYLHQIYHFLQYILRRIH